MIAPKYSFKLLSRAEIKKVRIVSKLKDKNIAASEFKESSQQLKNSEIDGKKRTFLKLAGLFGLGAIGSFLLPKKAEALVFGSTPASNVVGIKDSSNTRIDPATEDTLQDILTGNAVNKKTVTLTESGTVHTPTLGKKIRIYNTKFSLTADMTSISFRFASDGTDFEKYLAPKTGGLYGIKNHPNYIEGAADQILYCVISGTGTVQINIDYLEV